MCAAVDALQRLARGNWSTGYCAQTSRLRAAVADAVALEAFVLSAAFG